MEIIRDLLENDGRSSSIIEKPNLTEALQKIKYMKYSSFSSTRKFGKRTRSHIRNLQKHAQLG